MQLLDSGTRDWLLPSVTAPMTFLHYSLDLTWHYINHLGSGLIFWKALRESATKKHIEAQVLREHVKAPVVVVIRAANKVGDQRIWKAA